MEASGVKRLPFIPAFPKMNRLTKGGIHYIADVPVSRSVFGQDPFEPVTKDSVKEIIHQQAAGPVTEIPETKKEDCCAADGILVFDATSDESLADTAQLLGQHGLCRVTAGCAGFAAMLPKMLGLQAGARQEESLQPKLLVVCGSVNPITRKQLAYGAAHGYTRINLKPEQKLDQAWWDTEAGRSQIEAVQKLLESEDCCIVDSNDPDGTNETMEYADAHRITLEEVRVSISETLGKVAKKLLEQEMEATYLITGGDTLLGLMKQIGSNELVPVCEMAPGSVLTRLIWNGKTYHIITKSGGFGEESLLEDLVKQIKKG
jgi:uncharacterized protein YgbK (DUF1537 family)